MVASSEVNRYHPSRTQLQEMLAAYDCVLSAKVEDEEEEGTCLIRIKEGVRKVPPQVRFYFKGKDIENIQPHALRDIGASYVACRKVCWLCSVHSVSAFATKSGLLKSV